MRKATTNEAGEFKFDGLTPGTHRVWPILGRRTSQRGQLEGEIVTIPETGESPAPVELRLREAAAVDLVGRWQTACPDTADELRYRSTFPDSSVGRASGC